MVAFIAESRSRAPQPALGNDWNSLFQSASFYLISQRTNMPRRMGPLLLFFWATVQLTCVATAAPQGSHESDQTDPQIAIAQLISELGDDDFFVRDAAEAALLKTGGPAIKQLRDATSMRGEGSPDGEIQLRARRLLILIERSERESKIRSFLENGQNGLQLAGWSKFSKIAGDSRRIRRIFVDMHQALPDLMAALSQNKSKLEVAFQTVSKGSMRGNTNASANLRFGRIASLLFAAGYNFKPLADQPDRISISEIDHGRLQSDLTMPQMVTYINSSGNRELTTNLISIWFETIPQNSIAASRIHLSVVHAYKLYDHINLLIEIAGNQETPMLLRVSALEVFGSLAKPSDAKKLDNLLKDESVVGNYLPKLPAELLDENESTTPDFGSSKQEKKLMKVLLRDVALITAIKISGLEVETFGFDAECTKGSKLVRNKAGFFSPQERKAAFEKWSKTATATN